MADSDKFEFYDVSTKRKCNGKKMDGKGRNGRRARREGRRKRSFRFKQVSQFLTSPGRMKECTIS